MSEGKGDEEHGGIKGRLAVAVAKEDAEGRDRVGGPVRNVKTNHDMGMKP